MERLYPRRVGVAQFDLPAAITHRHLVQPAAQADRPGEAHRAFDAVAEHPRQLCRRGTDHLQVIQEPFQRGHPDGGMHPLVVHVHVPSQTLVELEERQRFRWQRREELHLQRGPESFDFCLPLGPVWPGIGQVDLKFGAPQLQACVPHRRPVVGQDHAGKPALVERLPQAVQQAFRLLVRIELRVADEPALVVDGAEAVDGLRPFQAADERFRAVRGVDHPAVVAPLELEPAPVRRLHRPERVLVAGEEPVEGSCRYPAMAQFGMLPLHPLRHRGDGLFRMLPARQKKRGAQLRADLPGSPAVAPAFRLQRVDAVPAVAVGPRQQHAFADVPAVGIRDVMLPGGRLPQILPPLRPRTVGGEHRVDERVAEIRHGFLFRFRHGCVYASWRKA